jgi:hypothetical protein
VTELGFDVVHLRESSLGEVSSYLSDDRPVVAFLKLDSLGSGQRGAHAVVVCGCEAGKVIAVDPSSGEECEFETGAFMRAWSAFGCDGLVVIDTS